MEFNSRKVYLTASNPFSGGVKCEGDYKVSGDNIVLHFPRGIPANAPTQGADPLGTQEARNLARNAFLQALMPEGDVVLTKNSDGTLGSRLYGELSKAK